MALALKRRTPSEAETMPQSCFEIFVIFLVFRGIKQKLKQIAVGSPVACLDALAHSSFK